MFRSAAVISAFMLPSFAAAQCPTPDDLNQGIAISFSIPDTELYYLGRGSNVVNEGSDNSANQTVNWTRQRAAGVFEIFVHERTKGYWHPTSSFSLDYNFDYFSAMPLSDGMVGGGTQTLQEEGFSQEATYSYSVHASENISIGDCNFAALDLYETYLLPSGNLGLTHSIYLVEFGFAYIVDTFWSNGNSKSRVATGIAINS